MLVIKCLEIFLARIVDVSLGTIKTFFLVKGKTIEPFFLAFIEIIVWYAVAKEALNTEGNTIAIAISYALGYETGTLIGSKLSKLIKGVVGVQIITNDNSKKLSKRGKPNININNTNNYINNNTYKITNESSNRNNLNHTNDNIYESKMFSMDTSIDNKSNKNSNKYTKINSKNNNNKIFPKNLDISSISSDKNFIAQKNNKSFSINNGNYNLNKKNIKNNKNIGLSRYGDNQSFYSTNLEGNRKSKGCFLLFEKASINRLKEKIGNLNKYNTNYLDTFDIKDI